MQPPTLEVVNATGRLTLRPTWGSAGRLAGLVPINRYERPSILTRLLSRCLAPLQLIVSLSLTGRRETRY